MAAGLATFREVLTRANYTQVEKLEKKLVDGYRKTIAKVGLQAYIASAGANGALMLYPKEIKNYRDWLAIDTDVWRHYWFGMVNRGVMANRTGGTNNGPSQCSTPKPTSISTSQPSKTSPRR